VASCSSAAAEKPISDKDKAIAFIAKRLAVARCCGVACIVDSPVLR